MPTPIAHSLIGSSLAVARLPSVRSAGGMRRWLVQSAPGIGVLIFMAVAPDLDYLPGIFTGDLNAFHQGATHSVLWCVIFASGIWCLLRALSVRWGVEWWLLMVLASCSHLAADLCTLDYSHPHGIPVFWPVWDFRYSGPVYLFLNVDKDHWGEVFQTWNMQVIGFEILFTFPVAIVIWLWKNRSRPRRAGKAE